MSAFPIRYDLPVPPPGAKRRKYPFKEMRVGGSFFVPCELFDEASVRNSLTSCIHNATYKTGFRFVSRAELGGIRVWRVS